MYPLDVLYSPCVTEWGALSVVLTVSLLVGIWLHSTVSKPKAESAVNALEPKSAPDLAIALSLYHLSARDLTVISCICPAMDEVASQHTLWKALWRRRYENILWRVPESLRHIDREESNPVLELLSCLENLQMPPRWWIKEPQLSYSDHISSLQECFGTRKQWKLFYFGFGMHWQKWVVAEHTRDEDCWVVIHGTIFDMTNFDYHPGGKEPFMRFAGFDATEAFEAMGHSFLGKNSGFGDELLVDGLHLPEEGNILRPAWLVQQDAIPTWKRRLYDVLLLNANRQLSYHDFWQNIT